MSNPLEKLKICHLCGGPVSITPVTEQELLAAMAKGKAVPSFACPACKTADEERQAAHRWKQYPGEAEAKKWARANAAMDDPVGALAYAGVSKAWLAADLATTCPDFGQGSIRTFADYAANPEGFLVLSGVSGCGKTWAAVGILKHMLCAGTFRVHNVRFIGERRYLDEIKESYDRNSPAIADRRLPARHPRVVDFLVFDDMTSTSLSDWGRGEIVSLIANRYEYQRPTIITTNLAIGEIAMALDPRVASRIAEDGNVLALPKRDLRLTGTLKDRNRKNT